MAKATDKPQWLIAHAIYKRYGIQYATLNGLVVRGKVKMRPLPTEHRPQLIYNVADVERELKKRGKIMT